MPRKYARRLAEILTEDRTQQLEVDLIDASFAREVAEELRLLGYIVEVMDNRPSHLIVLRGSGGNS